MKETKLMLGYNSVWIRRNVEEKKIPPPNNLMIDFETKY